MGINSAIEWTEATWNPVTGCSKCSIGCHNCYAERMAMRLQAMGNPRYRRGFRVTMHPDLLSLPLSWKKGRMVFVNSMSDLFHDDVPNEFIESVFRVMREANQHVFQVLTKRAARLAKLAPSLPWPDNVWMGVTIENQECIGRARFLREVPAAVRFLSLEPLLGPLDRLDLDAVDWVIVGGESGPHARPMKEEWVREIMDLCVSKEIPFFFKQWGGVVKSRGGREIDGSLWEEYPAMG